MVHGADSDRAIAARAAVVRHELLDICPHLDEAAYAPAVDRFLRAEARALMLHEHIVTVTAEKGAGAVSSRLWEQATAADRLAAQLGSTLGLDPIGHARIAALATSAELGQETLAEHRERGRQIIAGRTDLIDADAVDDGSEDHTDGEETDQ
jgi:hypothetical protein